MNTLLGEIGEFVAQFSTFFAVRQPILSKPWREVAGVVEELVKISGDNEL